MRGRPPPNRRRRNSARPRTHLQPDAACQGIPLAKQNEKLYQTVHQVFIDILSTMDPQGSSPGKLQIRGSDTEQLGRRRRTVSVLLATIAGRRGTALAGQPAERRHFFITDKLATPALENPGKRPTPLSRGRLAAWQPIAGTFAGCPRTGRLERPLQSQLSQANGPWNCSCHRQLGQPIDLAFLEANLSPELKSKAATLDE